MACLVVALTGEEFGACPPGLVAGERRPARECGLDVRCGLLRPSLAGQEAAEPGRRPGPEQRDALGGATAAGFLTRLRGLIEQPLDIVL